jgi:hypothetical protein
MTPAHEELLRLAHKAFPGENFEVWADGQLHWSHRPFSSPASCFGPRSREDKEPLARLAEYAALLVLAGELDIEALAALRASARRVMPLTMGVDGEELWRAVARGERAGLYARDAAEALLAEIDATRAELLKLIGEVP